MKKYKGLLLISYAYQVVSGLALCLFAVVAVLTGEVSYVTLGALAAMGIYVVGGLVQVAIDIAQSTSVQAAVSKLQYKAMLEAKEKPQRARRLSDRKKVG